MDAVLGDAGSALGDSSVIAAHVDVAADDREAARVDALEVAERALDAFGSTISNLTFQLDVTDNGSGGRNDRFALSIWDGTLLWHQTGTATSPITLGGGNITIHKK